MHSNDSYEALKRERDDLRTANDEARELAKAQQRNVTLLSGRVSAHRRVVVEHIRECQRFQDNGQLQNLIVALVTELDVAGLNISGEVRIAPKAPRP